MCQRREAGGGRIDQIPKGEIRYGFHGSKARAEVMPLEEAKLIRCCRGILLQTGEHQQETQRGFLFRSAQAALKPAPALDKLKTVSAMRKGGVRTLGGGGARGGRSYALKLSPQEQLLAALGLRTLKPASWRAST
jgi:hypothetical protein